MIEVTKETTVRIDRDTVNEADVIAERLGPLVGGKMSRSAVIRRAVHDLYIQMTTVKETTNDKHH